MAMASPSSRTETSSSYSHSYSSAFASSSVANFTPRASPVIMQPSSSTANVKLHRPRTMPPPPSSAVIFSLEKRSEYMIVTKDARNNNNAVVSSTTMSEKTSPPRKCMCSPTTHAGSFRCAYHKRMAEQEQKRQQKQEQVQQLQQKEEQVQRQQQQRQQMACSRSRALNLRRSAMTNSLLQIGVESEIIKRNLTNLIRPLPQLLRRREAFQPKPSRLSIMSKA